MQLLTHLLKWLWTQRFYRLALLLFPQFCFATLVPIDDDELSDTVGQAFIQIENFTSSEQQGYEQGVDADYSFTRVQFGMHVKTLLNIDKIELGKYDRNDPNSPLYDPIRPANEADQPNSDLLFYNFGLGHIDNDGNIVPFEMKDPFIEFAYDEASGKKDLIGIRFGFGDARGTLSNDIMHMTGNIDVQIRGDNLKGIPGTTSGVAELLTPDADHKGIADDIRATNIGISEGRVLKYNLLNTGWVWDLVGTGCEFKLGAIPLSIESCFQLSKYRSVPIGKKIGDPDSMEFDYSGGMFLSFQTKGNLYWGAPDEERRSVVPGAFFNVPSESLEVTFDQADEGISRSRTEFISRGIQIDGVIIKDPEGNPIHNPRWGTNIVYKPYDP